MVDPAQEPVIRLSVFLGGLCLLAVLEFIAPRRALVALKWRRWLTNLALVGLDTVTLRLLFPIAAVGIAALAAKNNWGLLNLIDLPVVLEGVIAVMALDLAIYLQHLASHKISIIWAFHKVHHADRDIDVTTALRFHPVEIVASMVYKFAIIIILGPSPLAVLIFEVLLNASAMFTHANVALPRSIDRIIRLVFVTPDMHRVHHSVIFRETDSNYGFSLSIWDRLFGTYIPQPEKGHDGMTIGLNAYQTDEPTRLVFSLLQPFQAKRTKEHPRRKPSQE